MAYREFTDEHGVSWEVWDVQRDVTERRKTGERRRRLALPFAGEDRRQRQDRRRAAAMRSSTPPTGIRAVESRGAPGEGRGWLAFQSRHEKRRLEPIPPGWERASDIELAALCLAATSQPKRRLLE
jgi:hypothetical protein